MSLSQGQSYYKISTAFERQLEAPILPGLATMGRFLLPTSDLTVLSAAKAPPLAPCLAAASTGQKVIIHNNNTNAAAAKKSAKRGERYAATGRDTGGGAGRPFGNDEAGLRTFAFGKEPTAIGAGQLNRAATVPALQQQEALLFGAATSLLAYDVDRNQQCFYKDLEDGVRAIASGEVATTDTLGVPSAAASSDVSTAPVLALVGGNCSVYGFDGHGAERYWTVTGDQVTAMMMLPWDTTSVACRMPPALVAASEDHEIRVFKGEEAIASIMEVDVVRQLVPLVQPANPFTAVAGVSSSTSPSPTPSGYPSAGAGRFAYLLQNGTVGVYQQTERLWRIKSKCLPVSAAFCDVDRDGVAELVIGYDNGRIEIRSDVRAGSGNKGGEVLYRDTLSAPVAAVLAEDYRQDGRALPVVCTVDGGVRGLTLLESRLEDAEETRDTQALEALTQQQALLASQLASLEQQLALQERGEQDLTMPEAGVTVHYALRANFATRMLDLVLTLAHAPRDTVIHSCVLRASTMAAFKASTAAEASATVTIGAAGNAATDNSAAGLSEASSGDDVKCFFSENPSDALVCPLHYERDIGTKLTASVAVGSAFAENYQVHELSLSVPAFAAYQLPSVAQEQFPELGLSYQPPSGFVRLTFDKPLRMAAIEEWMRCAFCLPPELSLADANRPGASVLHVELISMRAGGAPLAVEVTDGGGPNSSAPSMIVVRGETMDHCGDVVTSLDSIPGGAGENGAAPVNTLCEFPEELQGLQAVLNRVDELNGVRMKLSTDMADAASVVKTLLIRAEDARLLGDMAAMRKGYAALYDVDKELLAENMKRANNYEELKKSLKEVNTFIQKVGRLRLTAMQRSAVVTACRNALRNNKTADLLDTVRTGSAM